MKNFQISYPCLWIKRFILFSLFIACSLSNYAQIIKQPKISARSVSREIADIGQVELTDKFTIIKVIVSHTMTLNYSELSNTYIVSSKGGEKLFLQKVTFSSFDKNRKSVFLYFPKINNDVYVINYHDNNNETNWHFFEIELKPHSKQNVVRFLTEKGTINLNGKIIRYINNPSYVAKSTNQFNITRIELTDTSTTLNFKINGGQSIFIPSESCIQSSDDGTTYFVKSAEGVKINQQIPLHNGEMTYQLHFPKIDKKIKKLNFKELNEGGNWFAFEIDVDFNFVDTKNEFQSIMTYEFTPMLNKFSQNDDTLVILTTKKKGAGMISSGGADLTFTDTSKFDQFHVIYPKNISNLQIAFDLIDFKPYWYNNLKNEKHEYLKTFLKDYFPKKIDIANLPTIKENSILVITGKKEGRRIYIVDENNNKDFQDDSIRYFDELNVGFNNKPIKIKYTLYNGIKLAKDSSWISFFTNEKKTNLGLYTSHYLESSFSIGKKIYKIQVVNGRPFMRFCFESPELAIVNENGVSKDSILESEETEIGQYIKLDNNFYHFEDVSNDGRFVTLILENNISDKVASQLGFIAPDFNCLSIDNDSIHLRNYKGKYLLLANVSSCYSTKSSYESFKELSDTYGMKTSIIGIDNSPDFLSRNIKILKLKGPFVIAERNPSIQKNYRKDFCSRTCFLIDPEGHIVDKFEIGDWKRILQNRLK